MVSMQTHPARTAETEPSERRILMSTRKIACCATLLALAALAVAGCGAPQSAESAAGTSAAMSHRPLTPADLSDFIEDYVKQDAALKGGHFVFYDDVDKKALVLSLVKVHEKPLARTAPDTYFTHVTLRDPWAREYELDFLVTGTHTGNLKVTGISVHKKLGKARHDWYRAGGVYKKGAARP